MRRFSDFRNLVAYDGEVAVRRSKRSDRTANAIRQLPWSRIENRLPPPALLSDDQVEAIHHASLRVLAETGMEVLSDRALDLFADAGARVDRTDNRVRLDPALVEELIATAPAEFTLHARNPAHNVRIGGRSLTFCNATTPPFVSDLDRGRRPGTFADFEDLVRLGQSLNTLHFFYGYPVEAQDLPPVTRHLDCYGAHIRLSDKVWRCYALSDDRVADALNMVRIARAVDRETLIAEPSLLLNCNTNSPLKLDGPMADGLITMSRMGQPVVISAFTMAGAMAPITLAGAIVEQNAECLAGIALTQLARTGAPVIYGSFTSNVHMRSGAVALGTPEFAKAAIASGQMARRYRLPYKSSNVNSSNTVDVEAAYESAMAIWGASLGGANILAHGLGWLESGLTCSLEKIIVDAEMLQMMIEMMKPIETADADLAVGAIAEVGPGGHFFGTEHTLQRYETAFYEPMLSDWRPYETWKEDGERTGTQRANAIWKKLLDAYQQPALDESRREELETYVEKRRDDYAKSAN